MKNISILLLGLILFSCTSEKEKLSVNIIPQANKVEIKPGGIKLDNTFSIGFNNPNLSDIANLFIADLKGTHTVRVSTYKKADIKLSLNTANSENEAYSLRTSENGVEINASSDKGIYYGLQTLRQLLLFSDKEKNSTLLPLVNISDSPRFSWRGVMLDESRYFFGTQKVKQLLDIMAMHKLNVFHWHLTDVPGWRIEIKQYPKLTSIGAIGNDIDNDAPAQYYTQEEISEIVKYASDRFIEVIPEIDMPGHARAANRAYPEFSGGGSKTHPEFTFNPGYDGTYTYLTNILREVVELFPSKNIHMGGDEVHYGNHAWKTNKYVQELMKQNQLKDLKEVEAYFVNRMADSIQALGKTVIGWDEIVDLHVPQENCMVMWWRHDKTNTLLHALENGYKTVLCPRIPLYFDFDQDKTHQYGRKWKGAFSSMEMIHAFPPDTLAGFSEYRRLIKGIQANIWTERIQTEQRLDYMIYPRLSALAEAGWTNSTNKNLENFKLRLKPMLAYFKSLGINYYNPFLPETTPEPSGDFRRNKKQKVQL